MYLQLTKHCAGMVLIAGRVTGQGGCNLRPRELTRRYASVAHQRAALVSAAPEVV